MEYNKNQFHKMNDRKILHKIGKHWVTISLSTLMAIGGIAFAQHTVTANADSINNGQSNFKVNSAQSSPNSTLQSSSVNPSKISQNSAKSTSQNYSLVSQQANQLHTRILNNSIHQIKPSAVNPSSQRNSANYSGTITEAPTILKDPKTTNNSITVQYLDQHNHKVGGGVINGKPAHSTVDVISPNDGGIAIPNGYSLDNNEDPNFVFNQQPQTATLGVHGNNANSVVKIRRVEKHLNGSTTSDVQSDSVSGVIGSDIDIQPHDYVPKNGISPSDVYYIAPSDHSHFVTLHAGDQQHPTAYVTPNKVTFDYNEEKRSPNKLGTIMVHYQDYNTPGIDISKIPVNGEIGNNVDMNSYRTNVPQTYYYVKTQKAAKTFQNVPQDVVVYVKQLYDVRAKLYFENIKNNDQVVGSHDLVGNHAGAKIPYDEVIDSYIPKGYRYISMGKYDPVLEKDDKDVVYVEPGHQPTPTEDGSVIVNYYLNGNRNDLVKSESDRKTIGSPFSTSHYIAHPPVGYHVVKVLDGQNIQSFKKNLQNLDIDVASNKPSDNPVQQASVNIDYLDNSNPKDVVKTILNVKGTAGSVIDFTPFETSPNLPSGYTFNRVGSRNAVYKNGAVEDIYVNKKSPQEATIYIDYKDYTNPSTVLKTVSDSGMPNQQIDYTKYEKAPYLPKNYSFLTLGSTDSTFVNGAHEIILVKANQTPLTPPSSKQAIGTLLYKDDQSGDVEGRATIKGNQNDPINYGEYTNNGSQYMPIGYHFDKIADGSGQYLESGATYTIMVDKNGSNQPQDVRGIMYYLDNKTGKSVGTAPINGLAGEIIPYQQYESSSNVPRGYHFDRVGPDSGFKLESGGSYTILVNKNVQQVNDEVVYRDKDTNSQVGSSQLITGQQGMSVNLTDFENDNSRYMPSGYRFYQADPNNPSVLKPGASFTILVSKISNQSPRITDNVIYQNYQNGQQIGNIQQITGNQGSPVDLGPYENNDSRYMPSGYLFYGTGANNSNLLEPNYPYTILVQPKESNDVTAHIIFRNTQTGQDMQVISDTGEPGNKIDYNSYISQFLDDHKLSDGYYQINPAKTNDTNLIANGREIINVSAVMNKITDNIIYRDASDGAQIGNPQSITGTVGSRVNLNSYEINNSVYMPKGYSFAYADSRNNSVLEPNTDYTIFVKSNSGKPSNPQMIYGTIYYRDNKGSIITTSPISGYQGTTVNYGKYENNLPNGYHLIGLANDASRVLEPGSHYGIVIAKNVPRMIADNVIYKDATNGSQISTAMISGQQGSSVNLGPYEMNNSPYMPNGYQFDYADPNNKSTLLPNINYTVFVKKNSVQSNKLQLISTTLNYINPSNDNTIKSEPIFGYQGTPINYGNYMASGQLPTDYKLIGVGPNATKTFEPNGNYTILVTPIVSNNQSKGSDKPILNGSVVYRDNNGNILKTLPISGKQGTKVDYTNYLQADQMPKGYHLVGLTNGSSNVFEPNATYSITVAVNPKRYYHSKPSDIKYRHIHKHFNRGDGPKHIGSGYSTHNNNLSDDDSGHYNLNSFNSSDINANGINNQSYNLNRLNRSSHLPQTGEIHRDFEHQLSEVLVMFGLSMAALGLGVDCRRHNE